MPAATDPVPPARPSDPADEAPVVRRARSPAADRRAEIMDAAVARIVRLGFEGLRVRDVAADVGINNATLHHHFPTKAALVKALVERFLAGFPLDDAVPEGDDLTERLAGYVEHRRARMVRAPEPFLVFDELMVLARRDDAVKAALHALQRHWHGYLHAVCRDAGLDDAAATRHAERCQRELIGASLELCLAPTIPPTEDNGP